MLSVGFEAFGENTTLNHTNLVVLERFLVNIKALRVDF